MIIKSFFKRIYEKKFVVLFTILLSFALGFFISHQINFYSTRVEVAFVTAEKVDNEILSKENLDKVFARSIPSEDNPKPAKYGNIDIKKLINKGDIYFVNTEEGYKLVSYSHYYDSYFLKSKQEMSSRAKAFLKDVIFVLVDSQATLTLPEEIVYISPLNTYVFASVFSVSSTLISLIVIIFIKPQENNICDNEEIFRSPFHLKYWKNSTKFLSNIRNITTIAMLFALLLVSKMISLPSGFGNLGISFGFIFIAIISLIYGPVCGFCIGILSDIIGFFLFDKTGTPFFPGYTLQAALAAFFAGITLYKTKITFARILTCRILINFLCNVLLGSFCWGYVAQYTLEQTISYMLIFSLPKNIVYLLPQSIVLYFIIRAISPLFARFNLIEKKIADNISII